MGSLAVSAAVAAPGELDNGFGDAGRLQLQLDDAGNLSVYTDDLNVAQQSDGSLIIASTVRDNTVFDEEDFLVVRLMENGQLDPGFGNGGWSKADFGSGNYGYGRAVLVQPDDRIVVAGYRLDSNTGSKDLALARFDADGALDPTFGSSGIVVYDTGGNDEQINAIVRQSDGSLVVAGYTNANGGEYDALFARFDSAGQIDTTFGSNGVRLASFGPGSWEFVNALTVLGDDSLVGAGAGPGGFTQTMAAFRLTADGDLDTAFDSDGLAIVDFGTDQAEARAVAVQSSGRVVLSGVVITSGGYVTGLAGLTSGGGLDATFGSSGTAMPDLLGPDWYYQEPFDMVVQADDRIVVAGGFQPTDFNLATDMFLARFTGDGSLDTTFGNQGIAIADFGTRNQLSYAAARALLLQTDGRLVVAGDGSGTSFVAVARFDGAVGSGSGGVLSFQELYTGTAEDAGSIVVAVRRTGGATGPVSVSLRLGGGDTGVLGAGEGCDFSFVSTTLNWASGDYADKTVTINVIDDSYLEVSDYFEVELHDPVGAALAASVHQVYIQSDAADTTEPDYGTIDIEATKSVSEGAGSVTLQVTRSGVAQDCAIVGYSTVDGFPPFAAIGGIDFVATVGAVQFDDGESGTRTISIPLIDDAMGEADENFYVYVTTQFFHAGNASSEVTIQDNDGGFPGQILFEFLDGTDEESDGAQGGPIVLGRVNGSNGVVSVDYTVTSGTATAGSDFVATSGTISWADGDVGEKSIYVEIIDDTLEEGNETYLVTISNPTGGAEIIGETTWTQTIHDNDTLYPGVFRIYAYLTSTPRENAGSVLIAVIREEGRDGEVTVEYTTANGTAEAPGDYTTTSGTLTFADQQGCEPNFGTCSNPLQFFNVPIIDDGLPEGNETFAVTLSNPSGGATLAAGQSSATLTILANDPLSGSIEMETGVVTVNESDGTATVRAVRSGGTQGVVTVDFSSGQTTATPNVDYTAVSGTLTWADGESGAKDIVIPILDDALIENSEQFYVQLSNVTGGALLEAQYYTSVVITDDELSPGRIAFSSDNGFPEDVGTFNFLVVRTGGSSGAVSVNYTTVDGSATAPGDYTLTSGTLNWAAGETATKTIPIPITDDAVFENTENFNVVFSGVTGGLQVPVDTANFQITDDDDPGTISMDLSAVNVTETATTLNITATRSGGTNGPVSVSWATVAGTATAGSDYTAASGTLSWANLESGSKTLQVTLLDDAIEEDDETFAVTLSAPTGGALLGTASTAVTIQDNDANPGILRFTASTQQVSEAAATVQVDVERFGGSLGGVSVQYTTGDGTALAGPDYGATVNTLSWADGERTTRSFTVAIVNETVYEPDEDFAVTLSNPTGGAVLGTPSVQAITIQNDDLPNGSVGLAVDTVSPTEGDQLVLEVHRVSGSYGAVTVDYTTSNGSAVAPDDFTAVSGTLSWADGDTSNKTITIDTIDDATDEPVESFSVTLGNPTGGASIDTIATTVNLQDNDLGPTGTIAMSLAAVSRSESSGSFNIVVTRTGGVSGPATVDYSTQDFTALAPDDYAATSGTLTWDDFDGTGRVINLSIVNDTADEPDESFNVALSNATGATLGSPATTAVTILDDDLPPAPGTLAVAGPSSVVEGGTSVTYTFSRTGGSDGEVGVSYTTVEGTATAGADFSARSGVLTWADGDAVAKTVAVPVIDDALDEPNETLSMTITGPTGGATLGNASATTIIIDNDLSGPGTLSVVAGVSVFETAGSAIVQVERTGGFDGAVSVSYATADGTAVAGSDYTSAAGTLNWTDGEGGTRLITVPVLNDAVEEAPIETFTVTLSGATGGATIGTPTATVSITDDDIPGTIGFTQATLVEDETAGTVLLSVARTTGSRGAVSVDYATMAGSATAGADFTATSGTLNWADGDASGRTITVPLLDDALVEFDEDFFVVLSNPGGGATLGADTATVTLQSDEVPVPGTVRMAAAAISVGEDAGPANVVVQRTVGSDGPVSIDYATMAGTATAADFTATSGTLSWADGDSAPQTILVPITNDTAFEADETFAVLLSNPSPGAILADPSTSVTIVSEDVPQPGIIAMASATATVNEPAGTVTISVTRAGGSDGAVGVGYATSPDSATAADFTATSGTLSWADGDATTKTFTVPITDDAIFEPDESFTATLSAVTGGATLGAATTAVTIINDDPAQQGRIEMASATASIGEAAGTVTITVNRVSGSDGAVGVSYATAAGSATDGADFTGTSGTLSWVDGDATPKTFTVAILDDAGFELDETFTATLSAPTGGAVLGTATTTVTIVSDEAPQGGTIAMTVATATVAEADGSITLSVSRTGGADGTVSVNYASAVGTAGAGDFTAVSGTLTWQNGDAADRTIVVPITDDVAYEDDESFTVTLSGLAGAGATLGATVTTVTITSEDPALPGTLAMAAATATVDEFAGTVTISVTRTGGADLPVGVGYTTAPDTALSPGDFTATAGTLSWANGDAAAKSIVVPITNDTTFEADETFTVTISDATGGATLGAPVTTSVTIVSEDPPQRGTLTLASAAVTVNELDGTATLTVNRTGGTDGAVGVTYATAAGTAIAADFTASSGTLSWADGDSAPQTITVPITNDALVELDEAFAVSLSNPTGGAALGTASTTVTIQDDDILVAPGVLALTQGAVTVDETAGTLTLTVTRASGLGGQVSVDYSTATGTAEAGLDFVAASGTLTWPAGNSTPQTVTVTLMDDLLFEGDETFLVSLSNPTGGATLGTASTTVTVVSTDPPPDTTPDAFSFTDEDGMELDVEVQSNAITVSGINTPTPISITGGEYSIDGGAFTDADGLVANGASVRVRVTSSADYETTVSATLTIGGVSDTFSVTTVPETVPIVVRAKGGGGALGLLELLLLGGLGLGMRLRRGLPAVAACLALLWAAPAAQAQETGVYVGAGGGVTSVNVNAEEVAWRVEEATGQSVTSTSFDEEGQGYHLRVGYAFTGNFAMEAAYYDWGSDSAEFAADVIDPQAFAEALADAFPGSVHGPAALLRLTVPMGERWALQLRGGVMFWESEIDAVIVEGGSGSYTAQRSGEDMLFGLALSWKPAERFAVSLEANRLLHDDAITSLELSLTWLTGWLSR